MSTWTEVTNYIKTQLKPGVLGNTNVQKILNSIMAVINQINNGDYAPDPEALWDAETIYPADTVPVVWQDKWLVSNIADNEGNVPINASGVVHPTWRVIGSSSGSGIQIWSPIVYPNTLEIVFNSGTLYYLDRAVVGTEPFVSTDFATELAAEQWKTLSGGGGSGLPSDVEAALLNADSPTASNFFITLSELLAYLPDQVIDEGTVTFLSSTSLQVEDVVFLRGGVGYVITDVTIAITDNSETVNRVDILFAQVSETPLYTAGTEDGSQAIPTVPDDHVLIRTLFRNSNGTNTQTSPGNGGGTPNLQQVTNKGNSTSKTIQHAPATTDAQSATLGQVKERTPDDFTPKAGTVLAFDGPNKYGFNGTPLTGNLTFSITGAKETVMIKARHNAGTEPSVTPPGGVTAIFEGGEYVPSVDNILYAICHKNDAGTVTHISYNWTQNQS